jgi:hypothetical protein
MQLSTVPDSCSSAEPKSFVKIKRNRYAQIPWHDFATKKHAACVIWCLVDHSPAGRQEPGMALFWGIRTPKLGTFWHSQRRMHASKGRAQLQHRTSNDITQPCSRCQDAQQGNYVSTPTCSSRPPTPLRFSSLPQPCVHTQQPAAGLQLRSTWQLDRCTLQDRTVLRDITPALLAHVRSSSIRSSTPKGLITR